MTDMLQKLKEQEAKLKEKIKEAKKAQAKKQAAAHAKKCRILGAAVLAEMDKSPDLAARINQALKTQLTASKDRALFGLEPLPKEETTPEKKAGLFK